jgi:hypothetical protein
MDRVGWKPLTDMSSSFLAPSLKQQGTGASSGLEILTTCGWKTAQEDCSLSNDSFLELANTICPSKQLSLSHVFDKILHGRAMCGTISGATKWI